MDIGIEWSAQIKQWKVSSKAVYVGLCISSPSAMSPSGRAGWDHWGRLCWSCGCLYCRRASQISDALWRAWISGRVTVLSPSDPGSSLMEAFVPKYNLRYAAYFTKRSADSQTDHLQDTINPALSSTFKVSVSWTFSSGVRHSISRIFKWE